MPGLCLLDIDGVPYGSNKIMPPNAYFHIFQLFFKTANRKVRILPDSRPSKFVKVMLKSYLQIFWQNFENGQNAIIFSNMNFLSSPTKLLNRVLRYSHK